MFDILCNYVIFSVVVFWKVFKRKMFYFIIIWDFVINVLLVVNYFGLIDGYIKSLLMKINIFVFKYFLRYELKNVYLLFMNNR